MVGETDPAFIPEAFQGFENLQNHNFHNDSWIKIRQNVQSLSTCSIWNEVLFGRFSTNNLEINSIILVFLKQRREENDQNIQFQNKIFPEPCKVQK